MDSPVYVGFPAATDSSNKLWVKSAAGAQTIDGPVLKLNATSKSPVNVILEQDNSIVTAYNTANGTSYAVPTASQYNIPSLTVTIPAGERTGKLMINIPNPSLLSFTQTYAFGFKIASVDGENTINVTGKTVMATMTLINQYDGIYVLTGYSYDVSDPSRTGNTGPVEMTLYSTGIYSVRMLEPHPVPGTAFPPGAAISHPSYTVYPVIYGVTISSDGGPFPAGMMNEPGYSSRYEPLTKTFYVSSIWSIAVGRKFTDTLRYIRRRL